MPLNIKSLLPSPLAESYRNFRNRVRFRSPAATSERSASDSLRSEAMPWRNAVGGMWEEIGRLQLDFMIAQGLQPHHLLLDVGCGSLRAGVHFVRYLNDSHYYGIDAQQGLLDAGVRVELPRAGLAGRRIHLLCRDDLEFSEFGSSSTSRLLSRSSPIYPGTVFSAASTTLGEFYAPQANSLQPSSRTRTGPIK